MGRVSIKKGLLCVPENYAACIKPHENQRLTSKPEKPVYRKCVDDIKSGLAKSK